MCGMSPLDVATQNDDKALVIAIIETASRSGINLVNSTGPDGESAVYRAMGYGLVDMCLLLIHCGADLSLINHKGQRPLDTFASLITPPLPPALIAEKVDALGREWRWYRRKPFLLFLYCSGIKSLPATYKSIAKIDSPPMTSPPPPPQCTGNSLDLLINRAGRCIKRLFLPSKATAMRGSSLDISTPPLFEHQSISLSVPFMMDVHQQGEQDEFHLYLFDRSLLLVFSIDYLTRSISSFL